MISFFQFFTKKLRLSNPWRYKVPLILAFCYFLLLIGNVESRLATFSFVAAITTIVGFMGFGYLTNDLSDRKKDALAGKSNSAASLSILEVILLVILFVALAIVPWLFLPIDRVSVIFILAEFGLFVVYAFPPFRLKERGILGVVVDALYAHVVPGFLASWTFFLLGERVYSSFIVFAISLCSWELFSGIRNIVSHQLKDVDNDRASGTRTFVTIYGKEKVNRWLVGLFIPLEVISLIPFLFFVQQEITFLVIAVCVFILVAWQRWKTSIRTETKAKHFTNEFLDRFYIHWFPYVLLLFLAFGQSNFWWLPSLHIILFHPASGKIVRRFFEKKKLNSTMSSTKLSRKKVAVCSTNRNQYSETFIHAHLALIPNSVLYSDGYFPTSVSKDKGLSWSDLNEGDVSEDDLIQSWITNSIEVVLAEYGPAGVEVMNACQKANLPLVVHFHGFDAYRDDVLSFYGERYVELFKKASTIVVVSKDMEVQLLNLGCPKEKLKLIHYGVDTELFSPSAEIQTRENFIACGRFVAKKAPLYTIRAFEKVVTQYPEARLTFIGDGELFNEAKNLSIELGISQNIDFKGVLSPNEVALEMKKHAVFVQHSIKTTDNDSEGTPLSILEASSAGLAIVATKHGGIVDVVEDGHSGLIVEEGDVQAMSESMVHLFKDPNRVKEMGRAGRERVLQGFSQTRYIDNLMDVLDEAEVQQKSKSTGRWTVWKNRAVIFCALFVVAEIGLRFVGFTPGVIDEFYFHQNEIVYDSLMYADESGISHIVPGSNIILNGPINQEGFFSAIEYAPAVMDSLRKSGKKIVMLIGDSYTQGCCASEYGESFASLINQSKEYEVLNFGIPGADPLQYRLIVEKYATIIQPDLIVVALYGGNDIMECDRTPKPFVPLAYPVKNGPWLNSEGPIYLTKQGTYFKSFEEAKRHYFEFFSLWSDQSSFFEKLIRPSVLLSRPYMKWKSGERYKLIKDQMPKKMKEPPFTRKNLIKLQKAAEAQKIKTLFTLIPSPRDVQEKVILKKRYEFLFGELKWSEPDLFLIEDYDGVSSGNHFTTSGHAKYAVFLEELITRQLEN